LPAFRVPNLFIFYTFFDFAQVNFRGRGLKNSRVKHTPEFTGEKVDKRKIRVYNILSRGRGKPGATKPSRKDSSASG